MSDLAEFLLERIADDEAQARGEKSSWQSGAPIRTALRPDWWPRMLAECEAKRRFLEMTDAICVCTTHEREKDTACDECRACALVEGYDEAILKLVALPYADNPDYRQEWKP